MTFSAADGGSAPATGLDTAVLAGDGLTKTYGKLTVLDQVSFRVGKAEAVGIVGPNGAGKTTLLGVLSGSVPATSGVVLLKGRNISSLRPELRCRNGIGRAFQVPRPFSGMTVLENILVGASYGAGLGRAASDRRSIEVLELCGLVDLANRRAETLGLLHRKRLELARALATDPQVLLLDEIGGGLTDSEAAELVVTVLQLRELGLAIVWIEHIVHVLLQVIDRLVCMDAGRVIADGDPHEVLRDAAVIDAYLGRAAE
ncbi:branched-chain amino acid transport system ATP-binding protein [Nakamurella sp. UYEF19]|uniref:ABC transporter ATP-binding protein n=1 Tax=Nakamurella sp. UYEF19 TaxID=1756392 RepID=UPI00339AFCC5